LKITRIEPKVYRIRLKIPYRSAKRANIVTHSHLDVVMVEITTDSGVKGFGEIPYIPKMLETPTTIREVLEERIQPILIGEDPFNIEYILRKVKNAYKVPEPVMAAIDVALHDIIGKELGIPVYKLLGGKLPGKTAIASSLIPLVDPEDAANIAEEYLKNGVRLLKMKVGDNPETDIARVKSIRERVGDKVILNIDVGESWGTAKRAKQIIKRLEKIWVDFIEQPVLAHDIDGLREVTMSTDITIVADESVRQEYVMKIIEKRAADMLALKITGQGGITMVKRYAALAEEGGIECSIGSYIAQTGILDAASLHIFVSTPAVSVSEIGRSAILLDDNPFKGIIVENGEVKLRELPGLGVSVNSI